MAFVMLAGVMLLFLLSYLFTDKDFLSPVNLYLLYAMCAVAGMFLCYKEWNVSEYGTTAAGVFLLGSFCFALGCFGAKHIISRAIGRKGKAETDETEANENQVPERIEIGWIKIVIMIAVAAAALYGTWIWLIRLEGDSRRYTISQYINNRRDLDLKGRLVGELVKGRFWMLLTECSGAFASLSTYVLIRNAVNRKYKWRDLLLLVPIVLCALEYLSLSNRGGIILMTFAAIMSWFVSIKLKKGWHKTINKQIIKIALLTLAIFIPMFFGSLSLLGRQIYLKYFGYKQYTAIYVSGGVRCLDLYVKEPVDPPSRFGEETLVALHANLYSRFGIGENTTRYLEWRLLNDEPVANTFTAFRRFYHDFGVVGVVLLPLIQGLIISGLYYEIQKRSKRGRIGFIEVMYCYMAHTTIYIAIDDLFYSSWASLYGIKMTAILFAAYFFLFRIFRKENGGIRIDWKGNGIVHAKD